MGNHVHILFVETRDDQTWAAGCIGFNGAYAQYFNRRHGHSGHLFKDRYGARPVTSDGQLSDRGLHRPQPGHGRAVLLPPRPGPGEATAAIVRPAPAWLDLARLVAYFGAPEASVARAICSSWLP